MSTGEVELKALMVASLAGDAAAYRRLLANTGAHLKRYYARRLHSAADADDLVQETLMAIHTRRATYDPGLPFTAWLHGIARYKLIDHFRRTKVRATVPIDDEFDLAAPDEAEPAMARRDLERLLASVPEPQRGYIRAVKLEGRSIAEAAAATGQSETAVKVAMHRALTRLAERLREEDGR